MIYRPLATCDHLAVELSTEPQSTAPSATATKGGTHPTMTQWTVERDQRRTTCDHLAVTEDHLKTDETPYQDKKSADVHRNQFSSWAKGGEDTLDEAAPHHFDCTYSVRLYGWSMRVCVISGAAYTDQTHDHSGAAYTDQTNDYKKSQQTSLPWGSLRLPPINRMVHYTLLLMFILFIPYLRNIWIICT